jgi:hypothetical protein
MGWRHADIDHCVIGALLAHQSQQLRPVPRLADDLAPAPLEQAREALAHQHVILGHDDSRTARIDVGHRQSIAQHERSN